MASPKHTPSMQPIIKSISLRLPNIIQPIIRLSKRRVPNIIHQKDIPVSKIFHTYFV